MKPKEFGLHGKERNACTSQLGQNFVNPGLLYKDTAVTALSTRCLTGHRGLPGMIICSASRAKLCLEGLAPS